ncbi:phosphoenolpyruvate carboxylase [Botrimarina mediterranea]|uniref:Phosphoenolpyruvate carboxylase n=1 Tax=Botrimarina mediterranea TaxID=2528022 RepID=A0A518K5R9_9BACT|nr:phosphoenolpyruvate carboxylase [Botrimarina mediterranea]QDV73143.1 Phosphoenolpyruvate carboxylase [Botrimarina mediterranea]
MATDQRLRREIDDLGRIFGDTVRRFAGDGAFELVESVRRLARRFCDGDLAAADELDALLRGLTADQLRVLTRSFGTFLELANLAEDRQRVRSLRDRERDEHPNPRKESILDAVRKLKELGVPAEQVAELVERVHVELVFTAHPTEAKRKSIRGKLRVLRQILLRLDTHTLTQREEESQRDLVRREIEKLWQTDIIRPTRPTVIEEVDRGLSFMPVIWDTAPQIVGELREAVAEVYPDVAVATSGVLRFGSWMGGDRDGHPYVTPEITEQTLGYLRKAALERHWKTCDALITSVSISVRQAPPLDALFEPIAAACAKWPELPDLLEPIPPLEAPRRWLRIVGWRIEQTLADAPEGLGPSPVYRSAEELAADVRRVRDALVESGDLEVAETEIDPWLDQIATFGLHMARLDVRQHSELYAGVMVEVWRAIGLVKPDEAIDEDRRCELLVETLPIAANLDPVGLSDTAQETLELFRVLRRAARRHGMACLGGHVVSMTKHASDLLTILWLWKWSERVDGGAPEDPCLCLPAIPLFETISDLESATEILGKALATPAYRQHVRDCGDRQTVMIGYSDSTKDGGYLAAAWALQSGQIAVHDLAEKHGVDVTFFHGRGGSLGRGGGPAARSILSLPPETFDGSLRLTEQGEVLAERYDDPAIAHRHLEQVIWAVLMATTTPPPKPTSGYREQMQRMAEASLAAYRELVTHPAFVRFFREATPIGEIENLPIGSRPAKRKKGDAIEDLRAIPWVFAWTQCRCLLPAWYGLGAGLEVLLAEKGGQETLRQMYEQWPFFRATISNAELALAKSNRPVFDRYAKNSAADAGMAEIAELLDAEYERARRTLLAVTGEQELLDTVPWLKESIKVRNRYVDPLNLIQLEVMRRIRETADPPEELRHLSQLSIKCVAAGMRTTG